MDGWYHQLNGHKFEQNQEMVKDREAWHAAWCHKELDTTMRLYSKHGKLALEKEIEEQVSKYQPKLSPSRDHT